MRKKYTTLVRDTITNRGYFIPLLIFIMFTITFNSKVISSPSLNMQVTGASFNIVNGIYVYGGMRDGASYYEKVVPGPTIYLYRELTAGTEWHIGESLTGGYSDVYYWAFDLSDVALTPEGLDFIYLGNYGTGSTSFPTVSSTPLPVELTTFTVAISNNIVELNWETATEVNNYGFEIEKKILKQVQNDSWEKVSFVEGHGNSNSPKYYTYTDKLVEASGKYLYRLKQVDIDGTFEYSDEVEINLGSPNKFELAQNYPNPFNPTTSISYSIPNAGIVTLIIYDIIGNEVAVLVNGNKSAGTYSQIFNASKLTSGIYFYTIRANEYVETKKMLLIK
jgi:hypothetical protein